MQQESASSQKARVPRHVTPTYSRAESSSAAERRAETHPEQGRAEVLNQLILAIHKTHISYTRQLEASAGAYQAMHQAHDLVCRNIEYMLAKLAKAKPDLTQLTDLDRHVHALYDSYRREGYDHPSTVLGIRRDVCDQVNGLKQAYDRQNQQGNVLSNTGETHASASESYEPAVEQEGIRRVREGEPLHVLLRREIQDARGMAARMGQSISDVLNSRMELYESYHLGEGTREQQALGGAIRDAAFDAHPTTGGPTLWQVLESRIQSLEQQQAQLFWQSPTG